MVKQLLSALRIQNWSAKTIRGFFLFIAVILGLSICYDFGTGIFTPKKTLGGLSFVTLPRGKILIAGISNVGETLFEELRVGDVILGVEGMELSSSNWPVVSDSLGRIEVGEMIELQLYRDRSVITRRVLNRYYTLDEKITLYLTTNFGDTKRSVEFIVGLLFLIIGYIVVLANPSGRIQRRFAVASIAVFLFFCRSVLPIGVVIGYFVPGELTSQAPWFVGYSVLFGTVNFIAGSLMLYYFAFPVHTPPSSKRWFPIALTVIGVIHSVAFGYLIATISPGMLMQSTQIPPQNSFDLGALLLPTIPLLFFLISVVVFAYNYVWRVEREHRNTLRYVFLGLFLAVIGVISMDTHGYVNPLIFYTLSWYKQLLAVLVYGFLFILKHSFYGLLAVPFLFAYSIFRYRLMDTHVVIKRSMTFGILTVCVAIIAVSVETFFGQYIIETFSIESNATANMTVVVGSMLLMYPLKGRVERLIERKLYQDRYQYQKALTAFSKELPMQNDLGEIVSSTVTHVMGTMKLERAAMIMISGDEFQYNFSQNVELDRLHSLRDGEGLEAYLASSKEPLLLAVHQEEIDALPVAEQEKSVLQNENIDLVVPLLYKDELQGMILLGPKLSGKLFSEEDIDLLETVAHQAAIAIQNARLSMEVAEKRRIESQVVSARKITDDLLPKGSFLFDNLEVSGISLTGDSVGGDYFDYIQTDDGKLLVVLADAAGEGVSAAVYMSKIEGMIRVTADLTDSPHEILSHINKYARKHFDKKLFVGISLVRFDPQCNEVTYCRAGQSKPIFINGAGAELLETSGVALGLVGEREFDESLEEKTISIASGEGIILYTSGLPEARDSGKEEFGVERLLEICAGHTSQSSQKIHDAILQSVQAFSGDEPLHDDLTLVVVKAVTDSSIVASE